MNISYFGDTHIGDNMSENKVHKLLPMLNSYGHDMSIEAIDILTYYVYEISKNASAIVSNPDYLFKYLIIEQMRDLPPDWLMIATHKVINDIFGEEENNLSAFDFDKLIVSIYFSIFYFNRQFDLFKRDKLWRVRFSQHIEFLQKYALGVTKLILQDNKIYPDFVERLSRCGFSFPKIKQKTEAKFKSWFIWQCFISYPELESKLIKTGSLMLNAKLIISESLYILENNALRISSFDLVLGLHYKNNVINELRSKIEAIENEKVDEFYNSVRSKFSKRMKLKQTGRPPIEKRDMLHTLVEFRDKHKNLKISAVIRRVAKKYGVDESTIRNWFADYRFLLPDYNKFEGLKNAEILEIITKSEIDQLYDDYLKYKSEG